MDETSVLVTTPRFAGHQKQQNTRRHQRHEDSADCEAVNKHNDLRTTVFLAVSSYPRKQQIFSALWGDGRPAVARSEP